ncbi:hypothetical protein LACPH_000651 [Lacticaseibacillus parahuelsenbergensis]|uniref:Uncharacterized protein n=1 Tax=Lacticaseibacillus parahuelsenbergensis TaxID=3068305 RepID=A0ABY9L8E5_9LACO|nr:hypothetical protein [Lacticaseibacillus sp. NCIMB 15471]WLV78676.1 hypothetical protein LACPH_000651 [Lacticaseibacillus sp. NCIMB 15471]
MNLHAINSLRRKHRLIRKQKQLIRLGDWLNDAVDAVLLGMMGEKLPVFSHPPHSMENPLIMDYIISMKAINIFI